MTGYFARLATRTGVGGEATPPSQGEATPPLAVEDIVTFVAQPERPAAIEATPSPRAAAAAPASVSRLDLLQPRAVTGAAEVRAVDAHADAAAPSTQTVFAITERAHPDLSGPPVETETRIVEAAVVTLPSYPAEATPSPIAPQAPVRTDSSVAWSEPKLQSAPTRRGRVAEAVAAKGYATVPSFSSIRIDRPDFVTPREPVPPSASGRTPQRPPQGPSVRIGSVQVDVHAAPDRPTAPPPQASPPTPAAPQPPRAPLLRRFYLRDW